MKLSPLCTAVFALTLTLVSLRAFASQTNALDGSYKALSLKPDSYDFARYTLTLANGEMIMKQDDNGTELKKAAVIEDGAQADFAATLKNPLPAGLVLYKTQLSDDNSAQSVGITIVSQTIAPSQPRLGFYVIDNGRPTVMFQAYDLTQSAAFDAAWENVKPKP